MNDVHRQLIEAFEAAFLATDAEGVVVFANELSTRLLGRDLTGARLATDPFDDDLPLLGSVVSVYRGMASSGGSASELIASTDESGSHFYVVAVSGAGRGVAAASGRLVVVLDISAPLMGVPAIRKVFSQISHDLRSPLTSIAGAAELLLSGRVGELQPVQRRLVGIVEEGSRKMTEILAKTKTELTRTETAGGEAGE